MPAFRSGVLLIFLGLLLALAGIARFYHRHLDIPKDCDEPGYLEMAEAIANDRTFDDPIARPFQEDLIKHLEAAGIPRKDYLWMLTPLAYHLEPHTGKVINQYPPGSGYLLSWLPKAHRTVLFPALAVALMLMLPWLSLLMVAGKDRRYPMNGVWLIAVTILLFLLIRPVATEFSRISSVGLTYGFLIGAGIAWRKRPEWAFLLVALAANFRIAHLVLLAPIGIYWFWYRTVASEGGLRLWSVLRVIGLGAGLFLLGFGPYLLYTWKLMGNPLWPTYGGLDVTMASWEILWQNVSAYLVPGQNWIMVHLVVFAGVEYLVDTGRMKRKWAQVLLVAAVFNYLFFLTHGVSVSYYPHAGAVLAIGAMIGCISEYNFSKTQRVLWFVVPAVALFLIGQGFMRNGPGTHLQQQQAQLAEYEQCLQPYDIVWGNYHTGTIEYALSKHSFTLTWGKPTVQAKVVQWFAANGYRQVIWAEDLDQDEETIEKALKRFGVSYEKESCSPLGTLYVLDSVNP